MAVLKHANPLASIDVNASFAAFLKNSILLKKTAKSSTYPKNVCSMLKQQYKSTSSPAPQTVVSMMNSCFYHQRAVFVVTRKNARQLVKSDSNWTKGSAKGFSNKSWTEILAFGYHSGFFKQTFKGNGKQPSVFEIIHPGILEALGVDLEKQRQECIDFVNRLGDVAVVGKAKPKNEQVAISTPIVPIPVPKWEAPPLKLDQSFKVSDFGLGFLEALSETKKNHPYLFVRGYSKKFGFLSLPDQDQILALVYDKFYNDKFLGLKNDAIVQVNKAYRDSMYDVPDDQVSQPKLAKFVKLAEDMQHYDVGELNDLELVVFNKEVKRIKDESRKSFEEAAKQEHEMLRKAGMEAALEDAHRKAAAYDAIPAHLRFPDESPAVESPLVEYKTINCNEGFDDMMARFQKRAADGIEIIEDDS